MDRDIVKGSGGCPTGWLNDTIIDSCHSLLRKQYPLIGGLQPCVWATRPQFSTPTAPFLQIVNLDPRGNGTHWILLTNFDCPKGSVKVLDSAHINRVSVHIQKCIAQLLILDDKTMVKIMWVDCDRQRNGMDCGIYAIANLVALATQAYDPIGVTYDQAAMRPHLLQCLEAPFPFPCIVFHRVYVKSYIFYYSFIYIAYSFLHTLISHIQSNIKIVY